MHCDNCTVVVKYASNIPGCLAVPETMLLKRTGAQLHKPAE